MTDEQLYNWFTYHAPAGDDLEKYRQIRDAGMFMAQTINNLCPESADRTAAIRKIREAVTAANTSIAYWRKMTAGSERHMVVHVAHSCGHKSVFGTKGTTSLADPTGLISGAEILQATSSRDCGLCALAVEQEGQGLC